MWWLGAGVEMIENISILRIPRTASKTPTNFPSFFPSWKELLGSNGRILGLPPSLPRRLAAGRKAGTSISKPWLLGWEAAEHGQKTSDLSIPASMVSSNCKKH